MRGFRNQQADRSVPGVPLEVFVERQNLPLPPSGGRANEEIHPGAADAGSPAEIVDARCFLVVFPFQTFVLEEL